MPMKRLGYVPKEVKHGSGLCTYTLNNIGTLTSSFGQQGVVVPFSLGDGNDFQSFLLNFATPSSEELAVGYAQRFFLKNESIECKIVNSYDVPCTLTIYECLHRKDQAAESRFYPDVAWADAYTTDDTAGFTLPSKNFYGTTPFDSTEFSVDFKVISVEKKTMQAGQVWCYKRSLSINAYYDAADSSSTRAWSYFTRSYLMVLHGHVDRQASFIIPGGQAGISAAQVDYVWVTRIHGYPTQVQRRIHQGYNNLITVALTSECAVDPNLGIARVPFPAINAAATGIKDNAQTIPVNTSAE